MVAFSGTRAVNRLESDGGHPTARWPLGPRATGGARWSLYALRALGALWSLHALRALCARWNAKR